MLAAHHFSIGRRWRPPPAPRSGRRRDLAVRARARGVRRIDGTCHADPSLAVPRDATADSEGADDLATRRGSAATSNRKGRGGREDGGRMPVPAFSSDGPQAAPPALPAWGRLIRRQRARGGGQGGHCAPGWRCLDSIAAGGPVSSSPDVGGGDGDGDVRPPAARPEREGRRTAPRSGAGDERASRGMSAPAGLPMTRFNGPPCPAPPCQGRVTLSEHRGKMENFHEPRRPDGRPLDTRPFFAR